ncbi:hypothetical protein FB009_10861 [Sinorhizobium medicae]|nr:hypothetical protein FB007_11561 [Sinorhizobium medicae]TWA38018.1 hypothetical protein FB009_10861 [Sinorhizobium medicae]
MIPEYLLPFRRRQEIVENRRSIEIGEGNALPG